MIVGLFLMGARIVFAAPVELNLNMALPNSPTLIEHKEVKSLLDLRGEHVVIQHRDFSCGASSLATILKYYLNQEVHEIDVINGLLEVAKEHGTLEKIIERRGFSLLDLKSYAEAFGFKSAGYRLDYSDLVELGMPAIVPIIPNGYKHFVVFRGADDHFVYLADPSFGNLVESVAQFKAEWYGYTNVALVVFRPDSDKDTGPPPLALTELDKINVVTDGLDSFIHYQIFEPLRYSPYF
jgi:predicted double-glycine peptidase